MNNKSKKMVKLLAVATCVAAISVAGAVMAGCNESGNSAEGTATIDAQLTAANSTMMPAQVSTMVGGTTTVTVKIDGDTYTVTKVYSCPDSSGTTALPMEIDGFSFEYTFTGSVTSSDGDTYVLAAATACGYSVDWGSVGPIVSGFQELPMADGTGDETTNPDCLNYFYGPYVADADDSTKSMTVTISDGGLTFEGFNILPEV